jgi:hypothetical protein
MDRLIFTFKGNQNLIKQWHVSRALHPSPPVDDNKATTNHPGCIIFVTITSTIKAKLYILKLRATSIE